VEIGESGRKKSWKESTEIKARQRRQERNIVSHGKKKPGSYGRRVEGGY
jgi:hypothetical protein